MFSTWDRVATSDMQALRDVFDTNHNGKLDAADAHWSDFRVWQDANGDGVSSLGEIRTFAQLGIAPIDLNRTDRTIEVSRGSIACWLFCPRGQCRSANVGAIVDRGPD